jgi:type II secretory pathway pseudopilin PulG
MKLPRTYMESVANRRAKKTSRCERGETRNASVPNARTERHGLRAFTMIEIALSLAVIGFALVAIIGVLPTGMNAEKSNREETIMGQDAMIWMEAIRNGSQGLDDLTNYVVAITNTTYQIQGNNATLFSENWYTYDDSSTAPKYYLSNGFRIVGLMSTPKFELGPGGSILSNRIVAVVRAMSGQMADKAPQTNAVVLDAALHYRLIPEITPYLGVDTNTAAIETNYWMMARNLQTNLHELRLTMRWPYVPGVGLGQGRRVFRTMVGGQLLVTNENGFPLQPVHFFTPRNYVKVP